MNYYECKHCGFSTDDASVPDCPNCGGFLSENEDEAIARDDVKTMEEMYY
ncbi:MAG: hypothetical protein CEN92_188 [Candidatus Berkelbacteria bacterium Licking1014_96]|uniref:Rubredoxin-like domain-containing protein n=1 Tax=Candidatus Berkelbacteria bacterium Licking1014_96 TaxID=2017149 RepID=A0A554LG68_9BACT|nr:MAG: hypothetical protein CEN92_188 [Candidatus Berkelbacteria bacterium Licking1014_96]